MSDLPRIFIGFNQREEDEAQVVKEEDSRSWRTIMFQALGVEEDARVNGRPLESLSRSENMSDRARMVGDQIT